MQNETIESIKAQLAQLDALHAAGSLSQAAYDEGKAGLERRLLDRVLAQPPARVTPSGRLLVTLGLLVVALAGAGYVWKGSPDLLLGATLPQAEPAEAPSSAQAGTPMPTPEQMARMVDKLVAHLKQQPDDVRGWVMLARVYELLQQPENALAAHEKALAQRPQDPGLLVDYADALAVNHGGSIAGEPVKLIQRALQVDPVNRKALALMGSYAFDTKDYAAAVQWWDKVIQVGPASDPLVLQIVPALAEARKRAGLPAAAAPAPKAVTPQTSP